MRLEYSRVFRGASDNLIEVVSAEEVTVAKRAAKPHLAVKIGIMKNSGLSSEMFVVDLDEKDDRISSAEDMLSTDFARVGYENAHREAFAHCVPVEQTVRESREIGC